MRREPHSSPTPAGTTPRPSLGTPSLGTPSRSSSGSRPNHRPSTILGPLVVLGMAQLAATAEQIGIIRLEGGVAERLAIGSASVALGCAVAGVAIERQHWRISRDRHAVHVGLLLWVIGLLVITPALITGVVDTDLLDILVVVGHLSGLAIAFGRLRFPTSRLEADPGRLFLAGAGLTLLLLVLVMASLLSLPPAVAKPAVMAMLAGAAVGWAVAAFMAARSSLVSSRLRLRWHALLLLSLSMAALSRMGVVGSAPNTAHTATGLAVMIGVGAVVYAGLVDLASTVRSEQERALLANEETRRSVDQLVSHTRHQRRLVHDTRTALAAIDASLVVLGRDSDLDRGWLVGEVRAEVGRLSDIIEGPRAGEPVTPFRLRDVLDPMVHVYQAAGVPLAFRCDPDAQALGRAGDVAEIVQNLVDNAVRYADASAITIEATPAIGQLAIEVSDDGVGLTADETQAVFGAGVRGSTASGAGTGLGLYLARAMATAMNGQLVHVPSEIGTRWRLTLPTPSMVPTSGIVLDLRDELEMLA